METIIETTNISETSTAGMIWQKTKWIVKGCIVGPMTILFMIPMVYVKDLIREREERQCEVTAEISSKWAYSLDRAGADLFICVQHSAIVRLCIAFWQHRSVPDTCSDHVFLKKNFMVVF
jgi:inner membrane protein involved in colicin E2 resistance